MTTPNKRLDDLAKADTAEGRFGMPKAVEAQRTAFAEWRLPRQEAVDLLGERQLDEWRHRLINLAQWRWVRRGLGEAPGGGDGIQIASEIASYPPGEDLPAGLDARMTRWRQAFLDSPSLITVNYVVVALLAATVVGGPNGLPLRRRIADEAPDAWTAPPTERDGYFYEVWLGSRSNPYVVARAIMAMEGETLGKPWNSM